MKSLKIVFASLLLAVGAITVSSFTVKSFDSKAFALKCYEYSELALDNMQKGQTDFIVQADFVDPLEWNEVSTTIPSICQAQTFDICRLCFDDSQLGPNVTFAGILQSLYNYINTGTLGQIPPHGLTLTLVVNGVNVNVTVYRRADV